MENVVMEQYPHLKSNRPLKFYGISQAARKLGTYYNRIMLAVNKEEVDVWQDDPTLIEESELFRFARKFGFEIKD